MVVFCGTFGCTSKGYVERETSVASLERKDGIFQGSLCSPLKSGGFLWHVVAVRGREGPRGVFFIFSRLLPLAYPGTLPR